MVELSELKKRLKRPEVPKMIAVRVFGSDHREVARQVVKRQNLDGFVHVIYGTQNVKVELTEVLSAKS